jgi:hypothetical protein
LKCASWFHDKKNLEQKTMDWVRKILDKNDIETSWSSLKSWAAGGNTVDPGKENKLYSD